MAALSVVYARGASLASASAARSSEFAATPPTTATVELGTARIAEAEQAGALVEGLAGGVVDGRTEHGVPAALANVEEQRVPSACEQAEERRLERVGLEVEGRDVAVQVVDRNERQPARPGDRLRRGDADEERADQAGPLRDRDGVEGVEVDSGRVQRLPYDRGDELEMPARGHLGHDPAEARVQLSL